MTLASGGRADLVFELLVRLLLLRFLPFWLQLTIYGLVPAAVVTVWVVKRSRSRAARRELVAEPQT
ncbi:hypothetical protein ACIBKX_28085 [Streptomyces sp. NPDC050658]|uniref:hypothetical protein n=1 Tax=unclassified Streptomyces TaxID=2593676 RepID=UPI00341B243A